MNEFMSRKIHGARCALDARTVRAFHDLLDQPASAGVDLVEELRTLEELRHAISARQARLVVAVHESQAARDVPRGIDEAATSRLVGSQVGLARRCSPRDGAVFLRVAHALVEDMPRTLDALAAGVISERDATRLTGETIALSHADRAGVDAALADRLGTVSSGRLVAAARQHAYRADPVGIRARRVRAEADRRVSIRPAPDCMAWLTALLPIKDALACQAALTSAAQAAADIGAVDAPGPNGAGDPSACRGQMMADTLVRRITGRPGPQEITDVHVDLLMPLDSLTDDTPAHVPGYGPVPADLAREWMRTVDPVGARIRRLFTYPESGDIIAMESRARRYPGLLAWLIIQRDQVCRTPWCGAPIRHTDHIRAHASDGSTSESNGQGLCARCNYVKEHPDYSISGRAGRTMTRTGGLTAYSRPPSPPGLPPPTPSYAERTLMHTTWHHTLSQHDRNRGPGDDGDGN